MRRKHQVIVEVTFGRMVTEIEAKDAVEKMIQTPKMQWACELDIEHGGVDKITVRSATRSIASLRAAAKGRKI